MNNNSIRADSKSGMYVMSENSIVARLYKLQAKIDSEAAAEKRDTGVTAPCKRDCREFCSRCFGVSETEFIQILDYVLRNWDKEKVLSIIRKSKDQWEFLMTHDASYAQKLKGKLLLKDLLKLDKIQLPFPCVFLDENGKCLIEEVKPLFCRLQGVGYYDLFSNEGIYGINKKYREEIYKFVFLPYQDHALIRRPSPLFYFFKIIFQDNETLGNITEADFYRNSICLDEYSYIKSLVEYNDPP